MREIYKQVELVLPADVTVSAKARIVRVAGPRGELTKSFRHIDIDIALVQQRRLVLAIWHGGKKHLACLRTVQSLIKNMVVGVTQGFRYKVGVGGCAAVTVQMRFVYAHFPINVSVSDDGTEVEIRNFLGEKVVRRVRLLMGVTAEISKTQKDEIILEGISIDNVSQSAASIQQACNVRNKEYVWVQRQR
ncbi:hypothetical protein PMAC_002849 [Pneumocystis sp. 'macacae']|nr:hypothetical protein PMAC_002849 [Pneumocystis sp. 'macacae']